MSEEEDKATKKTTVITLISGKGGVGKTALTASVGKMLALMQYKVLMVDSDLITHGLTFLLGFDAKKAGLLEIYNSFKDFTTYSVAKKKARAKEMIAEFVGRFGREEICKISENLDFVQSTSIPSKKYSQQVTSESEGITYVLANLLSKYIESCEYDYILIDTQAGSVFTTRNATSISDKVVTIMEPDPVATYATENVVGELKDVLPMDSFYVINKLSVEEVSAYQAIENFLKILRHLPPIPFDFEVRRAFMIRQIPVDEKKPSAFLFGVIRMLKDLLPSIHENLEKFEKLAEEKAVLPIKERMKLAEEKLDETAIIHAKMEKRLKETKERRELRMRLTRYTLTLLSVLFAFTAMVFSFIGSGIDQLLRTEVLLPITLSFLVIATMVFGFFFLRSSYRDKYKADAEKIERELAVLEEARGRIRHEYEADRNLLITRSKELTLKMDSTEKKDE